MALRSASCTLKSDETFSNYRSNSAHASKVGYEAQRGPPFLRGVEKVSLRSAWSSRTWQKLLPAGTLNTLQVVVMGIESKWAAPFARLSLSSLMGPKEL